MESFWATFRLDPRLPRNARLRASDADREVVRSVLGDAFADGRLNREEYDDRVTVLFESRTLGELPALVDDLVDPEDPPAEPAPVAAPARPALVTGSVGDFRARAEAAYRKELSGALGTFLIVALITWAIWLSAGVHHFAWPVFPTAIFGVNLVKTVNQRDEAIDQEVRRLQRKQAQAERAHAERARAEQTPRPESSGERDEPALPPTDQPAPPVRLDKPDQREQASQEPPEDGE